MRFIFKHIGNRAAVLAFQAVEQIEALPGLSEAFLIKGQIRHIISHFSIEVIEQIFRITKLGHQTRKRRIIGLYC